MKFISWNVNGIRAALKHNFMDIFSELDADIFAIQDIRVDPNEVKLELKDYYQYWDYATDKNGYAGTAVFSKIKPISVHNGLTSDSDNVEGRAITLEFDNFYFVNAYEPTSGEGLKRLNDHIQWNHDLTKYINQLKQTKPVILGADMNIAKSSIDLKNPSSNIHKAGYTEPERQSFQELLSNGFTDTFRYLHPDQSNAYTWWSFRGNARANNSGWRLDYFIVSEKIESKIQKADILPNIKGSDHCPIELVLN